MSARLPLPLVGLATALALLLAALGPAVSPAVAAECPNQARRAEQGAAAEALPDCRAYEEVSPASVEPYFENSGEPSNIPAAAGKIRGQAWGVQGAADGEALAFFSPYNLGGSTSDGSYFLARHAATGWSTESITPPQSVTNSGVGCYNAYFPLFNSDFSKGILADGFGQGEIPANEQILCGTDEPLLVPGEPQGFQNLFLRDNEAGSYQLINLTPGSVAPADAWAQAASTDLSHVVFDEEARLTPEAPAGDDFYISSGGIVRLLTFLPDGTPVAGSLANANRPHAHVGPGPETYTHAVSDDGELAYFQAEGNLYLRRNAAQAPSASGECSALEPDAACTLQVDLTQGGSGTSGGGSFMWASADADKVFFSDESRLTSNSGAEAGKPDLYEYDLQRAPGQRLVDLTPAAGEAADLLGLSGVSEDGAYVYFVADGNLTGIQENSEHAVARPGAPNLYLRHAGATTFIAGLDPEDSGGWALPNWLTARVSGNGSFLAFNSIAPLTGYDNTGPCIGAHLESGPCQEVFLYDAGAEQLSCASCDPSGAPPTAPARISPPIRAILNEPTAGHLQRNVSDSGQVFFQTAGSLLPADTNSFDDVYEFQAGQLHLISDGGDDAASYFTEASASGADVFITTAQHLLPGQPSHGFQIYDAREGGGFAAGTELLPCGEADCKAPVAPAPAAQGPATATFSGPPNPKPPPVCKKGRVRKQGKCVKRGQKKKPKKHHKKSKGAKKRSGDQKGAGK